MNKQKLIPLMVAAFVILGGATIGIGKFGPSLVHAQTPATQVQQVAPEKGEALEMQGKKSAEANEPANEQAQDKNLLGGGHQDADGATVDHQFEGVE
ncbi:hypothetical protein COT49_02220 [candidate division WWE3 bacterium CG08_land_8_20_14_0_20_40_13]|uniref:Uncharacterized protein n=1 Tax=candidate division WWE3 bacterium CG08_land_8_20_14_0_20_40_13 TaxID=1975084 RepID=A0A2H0XDM7_UNCKA|nr:MAG: hypothetical protein COT49_02220 [candidate division WWE3 bacterium CG08_land_8_20_14_0_20_40_13]